MKRLLATLILLLCTRMFAQTVAPASQIPALSPAQRAMAEAQKAIDKNPKQYAGYNQLAVAFARRARETSDVTYYAQGEEAVGKSLKLAPGNFDGEKIKVWLLLGRHEFAAALDAAKALNKRVPDDVLVYGFLTDANVELGNYKDAEDAAQWMLDLRPGNLPAITRAAYLRELFGDLDGALELMNMAYQSTPPNETEDVAWVLAQIAHLQLASGKLTDAEKTLQQALVVFPGYHYALGNLAKLRIEQKRYPEAVDLLTERYQAAPHAENLYDLAEATALAGQHEKAKEEFTEFETKSLGETMRGDNSNRELIFYYADHAGQPVKALEVAQREFARRHDVYTLDAYAWALHVNGQDLEARKQIEKALLVGVRDAKLFRHAGEISVSVGDRPAAERYFNEAIATRSAGWEQAKLDLSNLSHSVGH
jgi:tetratricopeptide (TPR) repeat protein